jgi:hypothetical protein
MVPGADAMRAVDALLAKHGLATGGFIQCTHLALALQGVDRTRPTRSSSGDSLKDGHRIVGHGRPDAREKSIIGRILG